MNICVKADLPAPAAPTTMTCARVRVRPFWVQRKTRSSSSRRSRSEEPGCEDRTQRARMQAVAKLRASTATRKRSTRKKSGPHASARGRRGAARPLLRAAPPAAVEGGGEGAAITLCSGKPERPALARLCKGTRETRAHTSTCTHARPASPHHLRVVGFFGGLGVDRLQGRAHRPRAPATER